MLTTGLTILVVWFLISLPLGIIVGRMLACNSEESTIIYHEIAAPASSCASFSRPDFSITGVSPMISERQY